MSENIVDRINAAKTKDDLEEIGKELEVDVDKRKGLETIRAGLLLQVDVMRMATTRIPRQRLSRKLQRPSHRINLSP